MFTFLKQYKKINLETSAEADLDFGVVLEEKKYDTSLSFLTNP